MQYTCSYGFLAQYAKFIVVMREEFKDDVSRRRFKQLKVLRRRFNHVNLRNY